MVRFEAVLEAHTTSTVVALPDDVAAVLGEPARVPVRGTLNGAPFRTTVARTAGRRLLGVNRQLRDAAGVAAGDRVTVEMEVDDAPRAVDMPDDFAAALGAELRERFDAMSYSHQREYLEWIEEAKREETRRRRIAEAVQRLGAGVASKP